MLKMTFLAKNELPTQQANSIVSNSTRGAMHLKLRLDRSCRGLEAHGYEMEGP